MQRRKKNYFLTQAAFFSFSFLLQSTFLSSILPPPWAPAKAGIEAIMNAEARKAIAIFIETPCRLGLEEKYLVTSVMI
jgi:hypothetical protein